MPPLASRVRVLREVLADLLVTDVDVTVSQSTAALLRNLASGAVDAAFGSALVCARAEQIGARVVAQVVSEGSGSSVCALIKRAGSDVTLKATKTIRLALVDDDVGSELLLAHLAARHLDAAQHFASHTAYASRAAAVAALLDGTVDLCAIACARADAAAFDDMTRRYAPTSPGALALVKWTDATSHGGVIASAHLDAQFADALARCMVRLSQEIPGKHALTVLLVDAFVTAGQPGYRALAPLQQDQR